MFCASCGSPIAPGTAVCGKCGWYLPGQPPPPAKALGDDAGMRLLLPVGRSPLAIIAGYLGLISLIILPAPLALLFGILAVVDIRRHPEKHGMGRAIFGIVMGALGTIVLAFGVLGAMLERH